MRTNIIKENKENIFDKILNIFKEHIFINNLQKLLYEGDYYDAFFQCGDITVSCNTFKDCIIVIINQPRLYLQINYMKNEKSCSVYQYKGEILLLEEMVDVIANQIIHNNKDILSAFNITQFRKKHEKIF